MKLSELAFLLGKPEEEVKEMLKKNQEIKLNLNE